MPGHTDTHEQKKEMKEKRKKERKKKMKILKGLVSLFNGISTFIGYLMLKLFSLKKSNGVI